MKKIIYTCVLSSTALLISPHIFAACSISNNAGGMIRLQPSTGSTSNIQIEVKCDTDFNIQFNSQNLTNDSGQSLLKNWNAATYSKLGKSINVQYDLSGSAGQQWQTLKRQDPHQQHQYVIIARLGTVNIANLAAGDYLDQINISIDY